MLIHSPIYTHNVMIYDVVMIHFASYPAEIFATRLHGLRIDAALLPTLLESRSTQRLPPPGVGAAPHADTCTIANVKQHLHINMDYTTIRFDPFRRYMAMFLLFYFSSEDLP